MTRQTLVILVSLARGVGETKGGAETGGSTGELLWCAKDRSSPSRTNTWALEPLLSGGAVHLPRAK